MYKIYCINLPFISKNKQSFFENEESKQIILEEVQLFDNEKSIEKEKVEVEFHIDSYGFPLSSLEKRIFLTHVEIWKRISNSQEEWALVIENNLNQKLNCSEIVTTIGEMDSDWDVLFPFDVKKVGVDRLKGIEILNENVRESNERLPYLLGYKLSSSIYLISKTGALNLLKKYLIRQRVEDEIVFLGFMNEVQVYYEDVKWFKFDLITNYKIPERNNFVLDKIAKSTSWCDESIKTARSILKKLSKVAKKTGVDLLLQGGTHLGYVRHGSIMPWDDDIDLGINREKLSLFLEELEASSNLRFKAFIASNKSRTEYFKIWSSEGMEIVGYEYKFPFVDLWIYDIVGGDLIFNSGGIVCKDSNLEPFVKVKFENSSFKIPSNSLSVLDSRYKDWRNTIRIYRWSHRWERRFFYPNILEIEVNKNGRIISHKIKDFILQRVH